MIEIKLHGALRDVLPIEKKGKDIISLSGDKSVASLLAYLKINNRVEVAINDNIEVTGEYTLRDGDKVHIFTSFGGG